SEGQCLRCWEGRLTTKDIFSFLIEQSRPRTRYVMFNFNYDIVHWLRDLPDIALVRLYQRGQCYVDVAGTVYRIRYIPRKIFSLMDSRRKRRITIYDVFGFYQASFVRALHDWNVRPDVAQAIDEMKRRRGVFREQERREIEAYCFAECRLLVELVQRLDAALNQAGIRIRSWHGSGAIASSLLRSHKMKPVIESPKEPIPGLFRAGYYGGRIESFVTGLIPCPVYSYDLRSAYPAALAQLPSFPRPWQWLSQFRPDGYGLWHCRWRISEPMPTGPFPFRRDGNIYYPLAGEGWYWTPEVLAALSSFSDIEIRGGWWHPDEGDRPFAWVADYYQLRKSFQKQGYQAEKVIKLGLNSLYGVIAQTVGDYHPWQSFCYAGLITAITRARLVTAFGHAPWRVRHYDAVSVSFDGAIIGVMTDSITSMRPLPLPLGEELGAFSCTEYEPGLLIVQPGVVFHPTHHAFRTRGFSPRAVTPDGPLTYSYVRDIWEKEGMFGTLHLRDSQFIGLGLSLRREGEKYWIDRSVYGQWREQDHIVHFSPLPRKYPADGSFSSSPYVWLVAHPGFPGVSEPYVSKSEMPDDFLLAYLAYRDDTE
ncbi:MAG: DNA polymerase, partial [Candidatus Caldarchaeum sp.]